MQRITPASIRPRPDRLLWLFVALLIVLSVFFTVDGIRRAHAENPTHGSTTGGSFNGRDHQLAYPGSLNGSNGGYSTGSVGPSSIGSNGTNQGANAGF